jgi:hypothetical protein
MGFADPLGEAAERQHAVCDIHQPMQQYVLQSPPPQPPQVGPTQKHELMLLLHCGAFTICCCCNFCNACSSCCNKQPCRALD